MAPQIVVLGSLNMDLTSLVTKKPKPGETVHGVSFTKSPGGKGMQLKISGS
jgi:ribokinase